MVVLKNSPLEVCQRPPDLKIEFVALDFAVRSQNVFSVIKFGLVMLETRLLYLQAISHP